MHISAYDFGRLTVDGREYASDVVIHAGRVRDSWWRKEGHRLDIADLDELWDDAPAVLVVGTGYHGHMNVPEETSREAKARGCEIRCARTREAVALFNALAIDPERRVDAALHLTC